VHGDCQPLRNRNETLWIFIIKAFVLSGGSGTSQSGLANIQFRRVRRHSSGSGPTFVNRLREFLRPPPCVGDCACSFALYSAHTLGGTLGSSP